jgi:hypothetical protein
MSHISGLDPPLGNTNPALCWHPLLLASASNSASKASLATSVRVKSNPADLLVIRRSGTTLTNISGLRGGAGSNRDDGSPRISEAGSSCLWHRSSEESAARGRHLSGSFEQQQHFSGGSNRSSSEAGQQLQLQPPQLQVLQRPAEAVIADAPYSDAGSSSGSAAARSSRDTNGSRDQEHAHVSIAVLTQSAAAGAAASYEGTADCGQQRQQQVGAAAEVDSSRWNLSLWRSVAAAGQQLEQQQLQQQQQQHMPPPIVTVV